MCKMEKLLEYLDSIDMNRNKIFAIVHHWWLTCVPRCLPHGQGQRVRKAFPHFGKMILCFSKKKLSYAVFCYYLIFCQACI